LCWQGCSPDKTGGSFPVIKKSKPSATPASDLDGKRDAALCVGKAVAQASQLSRVHVLVQLVLKTNNFKKKLKTIWTSHAPYKYLTWGLKNLQNRSKNSIKHCFCLTQKRP
jgi:hypothetical protein